MTVGAGIARGRILFAAALSVAAFGLVIARLFDVAAIGMYAAAGEDDAALRFGARADLVDRNGALLARDLPVENLYAVPEAFWDREAATRLLAAATGGDAARLGAAITSGRNYVPVKRGISPGEHEAVMRLGLPGLVFEPAAKRFYPKGRAAAHIVGLVDIDNAGISGLELGLDARLKAGAGDRPVALALDMRVQHALSRELQRTMEEHSARAGGGIVMDVNTGEVLALVSLPDYEPNLRVLGPGDSRRNRMTQDVYELGSVFKIFAFAQMIEEETATLDELLPIGAGLKIGRFTIRDSHRMPPVMAVRDIFAESSNIGTARIALRAGGARQKAFLARLGLLDAPGGELPEMAAPLVPRRWKEVETATISYGHGVSVSPLAFAAAVASIVNGGTRVAPTFLRAAARETGTRTVSPHASRTMRALLRYVVTDGTGRKADVPGYDVGGKTGTAEKAHRRGYARNALISSFCGIFPSADPRYLVFVLLDEPKGSKATFGKATAGYTAAPLAGRVIARIAPILGVPRGDVLAAAGHP